MTLTDDLERRYKYTADAEALFFKNKYDEAAFRFEIPSNGWEFTDGFYIGSDPKGIFYYDAEFVKLPKDQATRGKYIVKQHTETTGANNRVTLYVHIKFTRNDNGEVLGEFLAKDINNVAASSGLLNQTKTGDWKKKSYVYATANVSKAANSTEITLKCTSLGKEVKFNCDDGDGVKRDAIDVDGQLTIRDRTTVAGAVCVRWYPDYMVFYNNTNSKEFDAFFFPEEGHDEPLGSDNAVKEWGNAQWNGPNT